MNKNQIIIDYDDELFFLTGYDFIPLDEFFNMIEEMFNIKIKYRKKNDKTFN